MTIITEDKERTITLKESEVQEIIRCMEDVPYGVFTFMNYEKIIKKLKGER
jgi:hypothetical protein